MLSPTSLRSRVLRILEGFASNNHTVKPIEKFSPDTQQALTQHIAGDELAIFAFLQSADRWSFLTTESLIMMADGEVTHVPLTDIQECRPTALINPTLDMDIKSTADELTVTMRDGKQHYITVKPGAPLFAFWKAMNALI